MTKVEALRAQWEKSDEAEINSAVSALVQHRHGRRLLWWLLTIGKWGSQPYSADALATAFACGELNVGQKVAERLATHFPEALTTMMKENADEYAERNTALGNATDADRDAAGRYDDPDPFADNGSGAGSEAS